MKSEGTRRLIRFSQLAHFTERQKQCRRAIRTHKYVLYGGAAGGGKSYLLRWWLLEFLLRAFAKYGLRSVRVGLFCEDYVTLRDRQLCKIVTEFPRQLGGLKETRADGLVFALRAELGGGMILPRNLDDPSKYDSVEFAAIAVDELTKNAIEVYDELRKRLRWPGFPPNFNFPFVGATNPAGIGHAWVKRYWIDRDFPAELDPKQFAFVPAKASDNPYNPLSYYRDLLSLPEPLRRAYAEGDWDAFAGQFFAEWRRELHVVKPFRIPGYWRRFCAADWGFARPFCNLWFAVSPEGKVYVYRELYVTQRDATWLGRELAAASQGEAIAYKVLDPACWSRLGGTGVSIAEQLAAAGWQCVKANSDRLSGWSRVREHLAWERDSEGRLTREPQLQIFETCENLCRTLPAMVFDRHDPEDLDSDSEDHAVDALRYGLKTRPGVTTVPIEAMEEDYAEAAARAGKREEWRGV